MTRFYIIRYESGEVRHGEFRNREEAQNYAESHNGGYDFTIEEYDDEEEFLNEI